jgi:HEAT repeat protein
VEQKTQLISDLVSALTGLAKLIKALRFYPAEHPSLKTAIRDTSNAFGPLLSHPQQAFNVNQNGFALGQQTLARDHAILRDLARQLVARRTRQVLFLPEVTGSELLAFATFVCRSAEDVYQQGGLPVLLKKARVANIWLNEPSLEQALKNREELLASPEHPEENVFATVEKQAGAEDSAQQHLQDEVNSILQQLREPLEDREHARLLGRLLELAPHFMQQSGTPGIMRILPMLMQHYRDELRSAAQQQAANRTLDRLLDEKLIHQLVTSLADKNLSRPLIKQIAKLLVKLEMRIAPYLLKRLSDEKNAQTRRHVTLILGQMGAPILNLLKESLSDQRWFVVRNTVTVIGDMRQKAAIPMLEPILRHPDPRVKRALIRALTMIGGCEAVPLLLKLVADRNLILRRPAILALGALKREEAISPLLKIVARSDIFGRETDIKLDAIRALAMIGSASAVPPLLALAEKRNLLRRSRLEAQRVAALAALGQLGDPGLATPLDSLRGARQADISRAAEQALTQIRRRHHVTEST